MGCSLTVVSGQVDRFDEKVDSIRLLIKNTNSQQEKIQHQINIAQLYRSNHQMRTAIRLYQDILSSTAISDYPNLLIQIHIRLGNLFQNSQIFKLDSAEHYSSKIIPLLEEVSDENRLNAYVHLNNFYYALNRYEDAMNYCVQCIKLAEAINDDYELNYCLARMAVYSGTYLQDPEKTEEYVLRFLDIALASKDDARIAYYYVLGAYNYYDLGKFQTALSLLDSANMYVYQGNREDLIPEIYHYRSCIYIETGETELALENSLKALAIFDRDSIYNRMLHQRLDLGKIMLLKKKYRQAIQYTQTALTMFPEKLTLYELEYGHKQLYEAFANLNEYKKALHHYTKWGIYKDSMTQTNNLNVIAGLEHKYQSEKKEKTIQLQQAEIARQQQQRRLIIGFMSILLIFLGIMSWFWLKMRRSNQQIKTQNKIITDQTKTLQQLDKLKSNFFANISHELRTPLTLMLGPINTALQSGQLDNRNFTLLKKAQQGGKDLLKLVRSILDLSKMEAGKMELVEQPELLFPFIRRIAAAFESYAQREEILFEFVYRAERDLQLIIDKEKITIILNNLLSNALKFTSKNGKVSVQVEDLINLIKITVIDTGRGIHPHDLPNVFNRFYQSQQPDAPTEGGTGIGLALSQEYAQLMQGKITVESQLGIGSTFSFTIPRKEVLGMVETPLAAEDEHFAVLTDVSQAGLLPKTTVSAKNSDTQLISTILVVEDNTSLREYIAIILSPFYQVVTAENGEVALKILQTQQPLPDLLISDIMMPMMDGYQLLTTIKNNDRLRHLPCIMLTARADLQDKLKALRIGVDDYLLKPFVEAELLVRIDNLLQNRTNRSSDNVEKTASVPEFSKEEQTWLIEFEQTLQQQIANPNYALNDMVNDFALSESTLNRQLKKLTGLTPARYLREIRLNEARRLLENHQFKNVNQVAYAVGFVDTTSFSRTYKKRFGKTPKETLRT